MNISCKELKFVGHTHGRKIRYWRLYDREELEENIDTRQLQPVCSRGRRGDTFVSWVLGFMLKETICLHWLVLCKSLYPVRQTRKQK